jgi:ferric-dicitrate binding protein FerR (iron transport regulator)
MLAIEEPPAAPIRSIGRTKWWYAAAAVALIAGSLFAYKWNSSKSNTQQLAIAVPKTTADILPGSDKAILTLDDGSAIVLDTTANGQLALNGSHAKVIKSNGQLAYGTATEQSTETQYHTISTPRGGQYQLTLADGTKVWLNAASSLHFPTAFTSKERIVEVTGEAYFEVAQNAAMPFIVKINDGKPEPAEILVLGTSFNIDAYTDEQAERTTLLEGAVRMRRGDDGVLLKPGLQAQLNKQGEFKTASDVNIDEVMAWKNGFFQFEEANLETIMRQISRWYDLDVVIAKPLSNERYTGRVSRNLKLGDMLKVLELSDLNVKIEGKKLIIE